MSMESEKHTCPYCGAVILCVQDDESYRFLHGERQAEADVTELDLTTWLQKWLEYIHEPETA